MAKQRSKPYPNIDIIEAVKRIESLKQRSGMSSQYDSSTFALGIGYKDDKSGAFARTVAALTQYGLVRREGNAYQLTEIATRILIPEHEGDRDKGIRHAVLTPSLFASLYNDFRGQELPTLFANVLVHKYGILDGAKNKAAMIFRSSLEATGLMEGNRVVDLENTVSSKPAEESAEVAHDLGNRQAPAMPAVKTDVPSTTLTKDFGEGRVVSVTLPNDITDEERKKLTILIENM